MVLDNEPARLQVGQQVPVLTGTATSTIAAGAPVVNSVDYHSTGVIMQVTPRVNSGGLVALDIAQEVSDVAAAATNSVQGSPTFNDQTFRTRVVVQDGQTVGMAGLIRDNASNGNSGIPFLKDIPILGTLVSTQSNSRMRTELLVLITPHVVHDQRDARALTEDLRNQLIKPASSRSSFSARALPGWRTPTDFSRCGADFRAGSAECRRNGGFALIVVLWTLVLIGFIVAHLTASGRTEIRIAGNLVANSASQAAADGADLRSYLQPFGSAAGTALAGRRHAASSLGRQQPGHLEGRGRGIGINPSTASPALLEALLRVTGSDPETARSIATAISEWVGSAPVPAPPQGAVLAEYRAAGLDYGPPSGPFETLGELGRVLGMTPAVLMAIRPHLTLFGPPEPTPATTDPVVAAALALTSTVGSSPTGQPAVQASQTTPDALTVRITALASGPGNARVTRTAVVRTGATLPQGYAVLAWGSSLNSDAPFGSPQPSVTR